MDVVVDVSSTQPYYYEFKSVSTIPPQHFAEQFLKDLEVAENLRQIRWYFDGKKVSKLDKELFLRELERSSISSDIIRKWIGEAEKPSKESLLDFIDEYFDAIFQIK